jgi:RNA polymerase sigma factor (sigma-70 family)
VREWQDWADGPAEAPPAVARRGLKARDRIVRSNLRLVAMVVDRYRLPAAIAMDDALQAGTIGLVRAAEKFDPARGYKFSTYSYLWIRQAITAEVDAMASTIRLPAPVGAAMRGTKYGTVSPEQIAAAELVWRGCISLDAPAPGATDEDARTLVEVLDGGRLEVEQLGQIEAVTAAWAAMEAVDPDGCTLLQLHHGDDATMTQLGGLEGMGPRKMRRRLEAARDRLRALPEVQMALAG